MRTYLSIAAAFAAATLSISVVGTAAQAAPAAFAGPYIAANIGGAVGSFDMGPDYTPSSIHTKGIMGGVEVGDDFLVGPFDGPLRGPFVVGTSVGVDFGSLSGSSTRQYCNVDDCGFTGDETIAAHQTWLATAKARLGVPLGGFMPYVTGGIAAGKFDRTYSQNNHGEESDYRDRVSYFDLGPVVGAGIEVPLGHRLMASVEYDHYMLSVYSDHWGSADYSGQTSWSHIVNNGHVQLKWRF